MDKELANIVDVSIIDKDKSDYIISKFKEYTEVVNEWSEKAMSIVVSDESQVEIMKEAREGRLLLKAKRCDIEKTRKKLKEQSLQEGRVIDAIAKHLTALIEPAEKHLELQDKYIEIQETLKRNNLSMERTKLLLPFKDIINIEALQLGIMSDIAFTSVLNTARNTYNNMIEAEAQAKAEEEAQVKADTEAIEAQRIENVKLRAEAELKESQLQKERLDAKAKQESIELKAKQEREIESKKAECLRVENEKHLKQEREKQAKLEAELQGKKDAEIKAENERIKKMESDKKEAAKLAKAPIKEQLTLWVNSFDIPMPQNPNETSLEITKKFNSFKNWAKSEIEKL